MGRNASLNDEFKEEINYNEIIIYTHLKTWEEELCPSVFYGC
jgi:hypothetical protein